MRQQKDGRGLGQVHRTQSLRIALEDATGMEPSSDHSNRMSNEEPSEHRNGLRGDETFDQTTISGSGHAAS
jgi:hypothetical protein